tara:strand:+ start:56 stop:823 length:768 start_codon:yes stop_codon:yes gene_type:complete
MYNIKYNDIMVNRCGKLPEAPDDDCDCCSNMTTTDIINEIRPGLNYRITTVDLVKTDEDPSMTLVPDGKNDYVAIYNTWGEDMGLDTKTSNILGYSGTIEIDKDELTIPISKNYSFFGVKLYKVGDIITFDDIKTTLPVCNVNIGKNYIDDYIMKYAGGVYLEYHDRPHFHMPRDRCAGGHIILGRELDEYILLAAFEIPYGYALYTPGSVIHNDCFLTGKYIVVYSKTDNYSNVLLRNKKDQPVQVNIKKIRCA